MKKIKESPFPIWMKKIKHKRLEHLSDLMKIGFGGLSKVVEILGQMVASRVLEF